MTDVADAAPATTADAGQRRFRAFISYSHVDQTCGVRLARDLERYRLPRGLVGSRNHRGEVIERRLGLVFRDRDELGASTSLKADIAQGVADIEAGRVRELDMNEIKQRGRATLAARRPT